MQAEFGRLAASMEQVRMAAAKQDRPDIYKQQMASLANMRTLFNEAAASSGDFHVQTIKTVSASEALTDSIQKQKLGWKQARSELMAYKTGGQSALGELIKEQTALKQAMATQWQGNVFGKNSTDMFIPKNLGSELESASIKYGTINQMLRSAATQTVNWGKNTQWAGRQIMVGLTVPLGILAAGAASMAMKVDQEMTRVTKVYDTVSQTAAGQEKELAQVREQSLKSATANANTYGAAVKDTLDVEAQLAQTGLKGADLFNSTNQAVRLATLGEMDYQKAVDTTISLQTAYKLNSTDLAKTFDFMNAAENATSLSIQDIADAIPRAGSAMAGLNVTAQQTVVMLGAMKEAGVDAAEAANALKSGATHILNVGENKKAVETFKEMGIDIAKVAEDSKGNMYEFMVELGKVTHGLNQVDVERGISQLFGTYQFNRASALVRNLGDAVTGTANQTAKLMQLAGQDSAQWAQTSETELKRWQDSVQGKFKRTIEGLKASLIPFGAAVLQVATPVLGVVKSIVDGFNGLPNSTKTLIMVTAGIVGMVGPLLMIIGILGNLFGNFMKFGTWLYTLTNSFKLMTAEQQAAALNSRNTRSAFNTQAQSAAVLAENIRQLTLAMEGAAVAEGNMMSRSGFMKHTLDDGTVLQRQVVQRSNGALAYAAGSVDTTGSKIGGRIATAEDQAAFKDMQARTTVISQNAERTRISMGGVGKAVGLLGAGVIAMTAMKSGADGTLDTVLNIAMTVGTIGMMFPGMFTRLATGLRGVGSALGTMVAKGAMAASSIVGAVQANGLKAGLSTLTTMAGRFSTIAITALKIFGPVGILAMGVVVIKKIHDAANEYSRAQDQINKSTEAWANILGYVLNTHEIIDDKANAGAGGDQAAFKSRIAAAQELVKQNKALGDALANAAKEGGNFNKTYDLAMSEALKVRMSGGDAAAAKKAFDIALQAAGLGEADIDKLNLRFNSVILDKPEDIAKAVQDQINSALNDNDMKANLNPNSFSQFFDQMIGQGDDLGDKARAAGKKVGQMFGDAITSVPPPKRADMAKDFMDNLNKAYTDQFNSLTKNNPGRQKMFNDLGIKDMDSLYNAWQAAASARDKGTASPLQKKLIDDIYGSDAFNQAAFGYKAQVQNLIDSVGTALGNTGDALNNWKKGINNLGDLMNKLGVPIMTVTDAQNEYNNAVGQAENHNMAMSDTEKLKLLNVERAKAGLAAATDVTQGFGEAAEKSADQTKQLAAAAGEMQVTADDLVNAQKSAMSGAWNDILGEAQRQFEDRRQKGIDAIKKRYDDIDKGYDAEEKRQSRSFDAQQKAQESYYSAQEKALKKAQDVEEKAMNDHYDALNKAAKDRQDAEQKAYQAQIDNLKDAKDADQKATDDRVQALNDQKDAATKSYDAQKQALQDEIAAEEEADKIRQKLFDAEQKRIERMAAMANSNIDFNVALSGGNLDEAARLQNTMSAQQSQWSLDDQQAALGDAADNRKSSLQKQIDDIEARDKAAQEAFDAEIDRVQKQSKARQDAFDAEIDRVNKEKDAKKDLYDAEIQSISDAKDAALSALKERQDAETDALATRKQQDQDTLASARQTASDGLDARRKANDAAKDNAVQDANDALDADKRTLAQRLKALQDYVPTNEAELRAHIADVQKLYSDYGVNLQMQGNAWGSYIGTALKYNVDDAAVALQTQIGWAQVSKNIADQIGQGTGMTLDQVKAFLTTGTFPAGAQTASPPYAGSVGRPGGPVNTGMPRLGMNAARHTGGGFSQADRVGVPRDASPYHSEVVALLKRGEFVVNERQTAKHRDLLEGINSGSLDQHLTVRHAGGFLDYMSGLAAMQISAIADTTFMAVQEEKRRMLASQSMGGEGGDGGYAGLGQTWHALDNIRKQLFPGSVLTSAYRPGANDWHGAGDAIDIGWPGNTQAGLMPIAARLAQLYPDATELIHNPNGSIKNGKVVPPGFWGAATWAQHANHVHWAMTPEELNKHHAVIANAPLGGGPTASGTNQQIVQQLAASMYGWTGAEWNALYQIVSHESGFRNTAQNPSSTAYGMFQFLNSTWGAYGAQKTSDPNIQTQAGLRYIQQKYGDPLGAWRFWQAHNWYDSGGYLNPGMTMAMNATGKPEPVFTSDQWDILQRSLANSTLMYDNLQKQVALAPAGAGSAVASGDNSQYTVNIDLRGSTVKEDVDIEAAVFRAIDKRESRNGRRRVIGS